MSGWSLVALILSIIGLTLSVCRLVYGIVSGDFNDK